MSNVLVEKQKIDILANAISNKSGEPLNLTLDEMVEAVDGIKTEANLQEKQYSVNKAGQELIQADDGYDGLSNVIVNVPSGSAIGATSTYTASTNYGTGQYNNKLYISTSNIPTTPIVTEGYIKSGTESKRSVRINTSIPYNPAITVNDDTVTVPSGYYSAQTSKSVDQMTLPSSASSQSVGSSQGTVLPSTTSKFINIPTGYNSVAKYYHISQMDLMPLSVSENGTYNASDPYDVHGFSSVTVSVPTGTARTSSDLTVNGATVTVPAGLYSAQATKSVASGSAGTPTATKGSVSNHSVTVTPSVTNTTGYITGGTKSGTAVTVSASELVSGSETKTENGTYDVTNLAELVVNVQGGGSSGVQAGVATAQSGANNYLLFGNLVGNPTSFSLICAYDITIDDTPIVSALTFDGTNYVGQLATILSNANAHAMSTGFSHSYNSQYGQIMISSENAEFDTHSHYILVYTYGGSASDIHTADVQVGSGATSITFPVTGKPTQWSCVFKSDFGTSSGYQRTIAVANDGTNEIGTYGLCLDSSVHASNQYWTASYSGGNLTISSQSTNAGGYFHQPGYYQLTYIVDDSVPSYQTKTVTPTTSQQTVTADSGYDALSQVTVNAIPSEYIIPSGNLAITQNGNNINVSQYATVSVNVSGGGGTNIDTKTVTNSNDQATTLSFTNMNGQPKAFFLRCTAQLSRSSSYSYYYITAIRYNGTNTNGNYYRRSNGTYYNDTTHYSYTYSGTTLTLSSSAGRGSAGGSFYNGNYELVYIY